MMIPREPFEKHIFDRLDENGWDSFGFFPLHKPAGFVSIYAYAPQFGEFQYPYRRSDLESMFKNNIDEFNQLIDAAFPKTDNYDCGEDHKTKHGYVRLHSLIGYLGRPQIIITPSYPYEDDYPDKRIFTRDVLDEVMMKRVIEELSLDWIYSEFSYLFWISGSEVFR